MRAQISRTLACSLAALVLLASAPGCSARRADPPSGPARGAARARPALGTQVDRAGRPLTGNALVGLLAPDEVSDRRKEAYNRAAPADWAQFEEDLRASLGLYDGLDRACGNQWLAERGTEPSGRYRRLAKVLADDRLWVDSRATACTTFLAVELAELATPGSAGGDCGGRTPTYDVVDVYRSLLVFGKVTGVDDGVAHDDRTHSAVEFPFLAEP